MSFRHPENAHTDRLNIAHKRIGSVDLPHRLFSQQKRRKFADTPQSNGRVWHEEGDYHHTNAPAFLPSPADVIKENDRLESELREFISAGNNFYHNATPSDPPFPSSSIGTGIHLPSATGMQRMGGMGSESKEITRTGSNLHHDDRRIHPPSPFPALPCSDSPSPQAHDTIWPELREPTKASHGYWRKTLPSLSSRSPSPVSKYRDEARESYHGDMFTRLPSLTRSISPRSASLTPPLHYSSETAHVPHGNTHLNYPYGGVLTHRPLLPIANFSHTAPDLHSGGVQSASGPTSTSFQSAPDLYNDDRLTELPLLAPPNVTRAAPDCYPSDMHTDGLGEGRVGALDRALREPGRSVVHQC
ncbi:hypothetical protein BC936DRAFT_143897 [Jimgerdemannia flammicorona]|uniref:Uncharacterized protein n=1 Tax=Jimgerdemannia flammicorona TaxID=994334 RepID=A0A433DD98_9FUNG|nr:hypothetical protein BC936DRAFT_143897 [Jimgerdemannia flammicorona]